MTPTQAAETVRRASAAAPDGRVGIVSAPGQPNYDSPLQRLGALAAGLYRTVAGTAVDAARDILVPGTAPAAKALARTAVNASESVKEVATAAGKGIKSGVQTGALIVTLLIGLYIWSLARPR